MRILYGVVGEGMGHATRSRVVLEHLLSKGHQIRVVVSGRAHRFLEDRFVGRAGIEFQEIQGLHLVYEENAIDRSASFWSNLKKAPKSLEHNLEARRELLGDFDAQLVISDFESWAYFFGRTEGLPVISIDNMQVLNRCRHPDHVRKNPSYQLAKLAVKAKLPGAYHYLVSSFFFPPVRKPRTTLIPPILRPEILTARPEAGEHVLVYQTATTNQALLQTLQQIPGEFRVYGMGKSGEEGNLSFRPFSEKGFVEDLRTAKAVIAGGGYSLMGEAVHLRVPMLCTPLEGQYEQILNAVYLQELQYGHYCEKLDQAAILQFLDRRDHYAEALQSYPRYDNQILYRSVDELIEHVIAGHAGPEVLLHRGLGSYQR